MSKDWEYFNQFEAVTDAYLPARGEGDTLASQIVTAVCKIVYKWYNDGDVYDNTRYLDGWANDLSSYANWLYKYAPLPGLVATLESVWDCYNGGEYEDILAEIADICLDPDILKELSESPKQGSVYECDGPFVFEENYEEEDEEDEWDEDYYNDADEDEDDYPYSSYPE